MYGDFLYCMQYQDAFPDDYITAVNFVGMKFAEKAAYWAETADEFLAIEKCKTAAARILA